MSNQCFKKKTVALSLSGLILLSAGLMFGKTSPSFIRVDAEDCAHNTNANFATENTENPISRLAPRPDGPDELLGSTIYGDWDPQYYNFNCYAFAINDYSQSYDIGYFSEQVWVDSEGHILPIIQLADMVYDDLRALGYDCIKIDSNEFTLPQNGQHLICVRASDDTFDDFHFMKYDNGAWYHKPGNTWVLKYNGTPSASIPWYVEGVTPEGEILRNENSYYDGNIYFLSYKAEHDEFVYSYYNESSHFVLCEDCMNGYYEPHNLVHKLNRYTCTDCYATFTDDGHGSIILEDDNQQIY